jgi:biopolymer transport protein ExbB
MMYPLVLCSIILVGVAIERVIVLRKANIDGDALLDEVKELYPVKGDPAQAIQLCEKTGGPVGRIFARGLKNSSRSAERIEMAMEQEAANEQPNLDANLPIIRTIATISPLMGLLGTIGGMIAAFRAAKETGLSNPTQILGGISEALVSTASGIVVAIIGLISYIYFANQSKKIVEDMEYFGAELVNYLTGRLD